MKLKFFDMIFRRGRPVIWDGPTNQAKDDAICYCGKCGYEIANEDWIHCPNCGIKILIHGRDIP